ncbi:MAG: hypothetical protein ACI9DF_004627 [Verrucomicrobiales bacterium]|jgi:hypothetical protein
MKTHLIHVALLTMGTSAFGQNFVFQSSFEYPNGQPPTLELDAPALMVRSSR